MEIKELLNAAWDAAIKDYELGIINSEGTLQANLYASIRKLDPKLIVLCVPVIEIEGLGKVIPDMVLLQNQEIVATIELKFVPQGYPVFEDDLKKLQKYTEHNKFLELKLDPITGKFDNLEYRFSPNNVVVFGVIGRHDSDAIHRNNFKKYIATTQFMPLTYGVLGK